MKTQSSYLTPIITFAAALILPACATTQSQLAAQDILLKNISENEVSLYASQTTRGSEDEICQTFYSNMGEYITQPKKTSSQEFMGVVLLTAIAGAATYGVGTLGIANPFTALSLAAGTNQVVYEGGKAIMKDENNVKTDLHPDVEISDAALRLGCPQPSTASKKLAKFQAKEDKKAQRKFAKAQRKKKKSKRVKTAETVKTASTVN